jgi:uptake hydrogenase small subunit
LSKSATPRRVRLNATADHVVVPPGRSTTKGKP